MWYNIIHEKNGESEKIEFLDRLPKTKIGKVDYNQLLENVKY